MSSKIAEPEAVIVSIMTFRVSEKALTENISLPQFPHIRQSRSQ